MSWIKGAANGYIDLSNKLVAAATGQSLQTVDSIADGGTGYSVGDILTLVGGTGTVAAQVEVLTVAAGVVATTRRVNDGVYTVPPSDPVATTGGAGTCTLNCTFASNGWTALVDEVRTGSDRDVILQGSGGGTDEIFVGWRTFFDGSAGYYNWELHGFTGYSASLPYPEQPGMSPGEGDYDDVVHDSAVKPGAYLVLANAAGGDNISYWFSVTPYRILGEAKVGSSYFPFYLGFGNRFATAGEYPYPMLIAGSTSLYSTLVSTGMSALSDPSRSTLATARGPSIVYGVDGTWYGVANGTIAGSARVALGDRVVLPTGVTTGTTDAPPEDRFMTATGDFPEIISQTATAAVANLWNDGVGSEILLLPCIIVFYIPSPQVVMEIDNVFWLSTFDGPANEDRIIQGSNVYRVFQNCARTEKCAYLAIKEG